MILCGCNVGVCPVRHTWVLNGVVDPNGTVAEDTFNMQTPAGQTAVSRCSSNGYRDEINKVGSV